MDNSIQHRIYGRRKGRPLGAQRQQLMEELLPQRRINLPDQGLLHPSALQEAEAYWLEIGFGQGEHLAAQAQNHPNICMIGCDAFEGAVAALVKKIDQQQIENIWIFNDDARKLIEKLEPASIDRLFVLFPDPWPKARHHKRRIFQNSFVDALARILKPGGILRFASDIEDYVDQVLDLMKNHPHFQYPDGTRDDWKQSPVDWVETKYQKRGQRLGHQCHYLDFKRVSVL